MIPFSILDLAHVVEGATPADALHNSLDLARHAEALGYRRFWLAEHHNMVGIASAATSVAIGYVAGGTETIRVGSGGIMLPNHSPLVIAEQFGTLASLYPGRIDLGLGRAPGTDQIDAARAPPRPDGGRHLPAGRAGAAGAARAGAAGTGGARRSRRRHQRAALDPRLKPLRRAARGDARPPLRLRLALRARRADAGAAESIARRSGLRSSSTGPTRWSPPTSSPPRPTRRRAASSPPCSRPSPTCMRGTRGKLQPPIDDIESYWTPTEKAQASRMLARSFVGEPGDGAAGLEAFIAETQADEIIVACAIYDHKARVRSYEILAEVREAMGEAPAA